MEIEFEILKEKFKENFRTQQLNAFESFQVNVVLAYRLLENLDEFPEKSNAESIEFLISIKPCKIDETLKTKFNKWIILAGFDELFKWIKDLLIDYLILKDGITTNTLPQSIEEFNNRKLSYYELSIPDLIEKCKPLIKDENLLDNFLSYNKARNCLHHANEILIKKFCTKGKDVLEINGRRLVLISDNGNEIKEIECDGIGLENGDVKFSFFDFCIVKKLNEKLTFSLKEFFYLKDLGIFLYSQLFTDLFGIDERPLINISLQYRIIKIGNTINKEDRMIEPNMPKGQIV